jgi:hypothetical protein
VNSLDKRWITFIPSLCKLQKKLEPLGFVVYLSERRMIIWEQEEDDAVARRTARWMLSL